MSGIDVHELLLKAKENNWDVTNVTICETCNTGRTIKHGGPCDLHLNEGKAHVVSVITIIRQPKETIA